MTDDRHDKAFIEIEGLIRECFGRVVYSHKTHEKCADDALWWLRARKRAQTILSAISSTGFISSVVGPYANNKWVVATTGIVTVSLTFLNVYMQGSNAAEVVQKHTETANKLWLVREKYLSLINDVCSRTISVEEAKASRDSLQNELAEIYNGAPRTNSKSYGAAQKGLKENEELTFSEKEIDAFLPEQLRLSTRRAMSTEQK
jgi:hypothetical protein